MGLAARLARLAVVVTLLVGAVVVAYTTVRGVGPPTEDDLIQQAGLLDKDKLLIGVKDDQPGMAFRDPVTGRYTGFDVEIASMVAADLGFGSDEVEFLAIESEDRARRQARDRTGRMVTVDLVVATFSITRQREEDPDVDFSAPYLRTEQTVLTRRAYPTTIEALDDLRGKKVCTLNTTTSKQALVQAGINAFGKNRISECVKGLKAGTYDAVSTDAAILAGFEHEDPTHLQLHDIGLETSEDYGINVGTNKALRTLVNLSLYRSRYDPNDRRWETAYNTYLRVEESDARPQQVAVPQQPMVDKPEVRTWPWAR